MKLINADCIEAMKAMPDNSMDSIVTDPPYELGFMGKSWDSSGIAFNIDVWREALRVIKHGGHLIAFGGSRTYHRMAVAIEDAGFEIRDQIMWVYGSGFPKSHNLKDEWQGWGTALKPAHEPMVLARKPFIGTVANNVLTHGTGGLNIDGCRVEGVPPSVPQPALGVKERVTYRFGTGEGRNGEMSQAAGRWPANFIHDGSGEVVALFPNSKAPKPYGGEEYKETSMFGIGGVNHGNEYGDSGSAARFFYCAKASKRDRNEGLDGFPIKEVPFGGHGNKEEDFMTKVLRNAPRANHHPTVKPTTLMQYLVRLVTPPNGIVLDPFMGSGSTGKACAYEGFDFIGIDQSAEYVAIAQARIDFALADK